MKKLHYFGYIFNIKKVLTPEVHILVFWNSKSMYNRFYLVYICYVHCIRMSTETLVCKMYLKCSQHSIITDHVVWYRWYFMIKYRCYGRWLGNFVFPNFFLSNSKIKQKSLVLDLCIFITHFNILLKQLLLFPNFGWK